MLKSPYLPRPLPPPDPACRRRPRAGTVSCIPFPPLSAPCFGLVQEKLAHEPFWLLIAVTFVIKTSGQLAIPTLNRVRERFPTPLHLVDPCSVDQLTDMIRHLGLAVIRVGNIQKYARCFVENPPRPGMCYRVRNYDRREEAGRQSWLDDPGGSGGPTSDDTEAWEIWTCNGKYAIDSWRVYCRDEMLGRAEDWNGACREPEFQPEWMRVMAQDKELRAYLRWMWMREGWEWDPTTGRAVRLARGDEEGGGRGPGGIRRRGRLAHCRRGVRDGATGAIQYACS